MKDSGGDVLRLWVSMVDYRDEVRLGKEVLARTVEAYRKVRNTLQIPGVEPLRLRSGAATRSRPRRCSRSIATRWRSMARVARRVLDAYDAYDFQTVFHAVNEFVTVHLSAFYADLSKDRLYTLRADSPGPAVRANRALSHRGRPHAPAGARALGHGGRALAAPAGRTRGVGASGRLSRPDVDGWADAGLEERWASAAWRSAARSTPPSKSRARRRRLAPH